MAKRGFSNSSSEPIHYLPPSLKPLFLATKLRLVRTIIHYGSYSDLFFA